MTGDFSMLTRFLSVLILMVAVSVATAAERPLLVLGDSLSAAYNMPESDGWVALLEHRLDDELETPPKVINASISGETTAGGLGRLPALLTTHSPGVVVIALGGNDGLRGLPPAQIRDNLAQMISMSREADAKVVLVGIDIPPNYGAAYRRHFVAIFHELAEQPDVALLPFFLEGVALAPGMMQSDGIHPSAQAQSRLLDNLWPVLSDVLAVGVE